MHVAKTPDILSIYCVTTGLPLPDAVAMAFEFSPSMYPYNAGVMLMNLPRLRASYAEFLK